MDKLKTIKELWKEMNSIHEVIIRLNQQLPKGYFVGYQLSALGKEVQPQDFQLFEKLERPATDLSQLEDYLEYKAHQNPHIFGACATHFFPDEPTE